MKKAGVLFFALCFGISVWGQGTLSGDVMLNLNFFIRDTNIKASNNQLYDNYLRGSEGWLNLQYNINGYTFFIRGDAFNNSNLKNPTSANTDFGLGAWGITKQTKKLTVTFGSIYDQIGSGILFRSYEDRGLLIDNALFGFEIKYKLNDKIFLKGFTGQQKNNNFVNNTRYGPVIGGLATEGNFNIANVALTPGIGILNRTLNASSINQIVSSINAQPLSERFVPKYNMYAFSAYNTLIYKGFSWYMEGSYKTNEAILQKNNLLADKDGNIVYTNISYGRKGVAFNFTGKRTQNYVMRTSPNEILLNGMLNRQPVIAVLRPERLLARYTPASQDISEIAVTANTVITPNDVNTINLTYTHINTLEGGKLFREIYADYNYQGLDLWTFHLGAQYLEYNIVLYQNRPGTVMYAITPFAEVTYRINKTHSLHGEVQYMSSKQDYGSWVFAFVEFDIAPKWSIALSDMYNTAVNKNSDNPNYTGPGFSPKANHYYNLFVGYTEGNSRFTLAYVKQVDGINCAGGVCRYEPAFSGVKATVTSSF